MMDIRAALDFAADKEAVIMFCKNDGKRVMQVTIPTVPGQTVEANVTLTKPGGFYITQAICDVMTNIKEKIVR